MQNHALHEAKNRLTALVHEVELGEPLALTRHGKAVAVLVGTEYFDRMRRQGYGFLRALADFRAEWPTPEQAQDEDAFTDLRQKEEGRPAIL